LLEQGLKHYRTIVRGYYDIQCIILCLVLMYLLRIKNPEQLKQHKSGELGKLLGLDRVPEAKCLRSKLKQITAQNKSVSWERSLSEQWVKDQAPPNIYYVDGHVKLYNGYKATLGKKHKARQKLCLPGISEFCLPD